jgi:glycosyltransferase involved in cell wall biosynthesis
MRALSDPSSPAMQVTPSPRALAGLTVVLPCLNEAANIGDAIRAATLTATRCALEHEIVVVDDGSTDETAAISAEAVRRDRRVRLIVHPRNLGYGSALRSGIAAASMPWILLADADLQFDLRELEDFLPCAGGADLMLGWRILRQDELPRRIGSATRGWVLRHAFHLPFRDPECGFKLVRRDLLERCTLTCSGTLISTELLLACRAAGGRVRELGVHHRARAAGDRGGARERVAGHHVREFAALWREHHG